MGPGLRRGVAGAGALTMLAALAAVTARPVEAAPVPVRAVPATGETAPGASSGDTLDDPAIWVDAADPARSLVVGNDKSGALESYDLAGDRVQRLTDVPSWGNVDVAQAVDLGQGPADYVVAVGSGGVRVMRLDPTTRLMSDATDGTGVIAVDGEGLCTYRSTTGGWSAFVVTRAGVVQQLGLTDTDGDGLVEGTPLRSFAVGSEAESCVTDTGSAALFVSEEDGALWRYGAEPDAGPDRVAVDRVVADGGRLAPDIEGVEIVRPAGRSPVLIVSAQSVADRQESYFAMYDLTTLAYLDAFRVVDGTGADDCDGTDGIAGYAGALGPAYPAGIFVCQDNNNDAPGSAGNQDFKYADLGQVLGGAPSTDPVARIAKSCTGLTCSFDGSGSSADGGVAAFRWDLGDGATSAAATMSHAFAAAGAYTVTLTVTDIQDRTASASVEVDVAPEPPAPVVPPTAVAVVRCTGLVCSVDGSESYDPEGKSLVYEWGFGDGASGSGTGASHSYDGPGERVVTLTVTNPIGASAQASATVRPVSGTATAAVVSSWGGNTYGELGDGTTAPHRTPVVVPGLPDVAQLGGGRNHAVVVGTDGSVWTWGSNQYGQLGTAGGSRSTPARVPGLPPVREADSVGYHVAAAAVDGSVWTWGYNVVGQLGDGTTTTRTEPRPVTGLSDVVDVATGRDATYALRADGSVWAWGQNSHGELGDGTTTASRTPVAVQGLPPVTSVVGGRDHALALTADGRVLAWGWNAYGQVGDGTTTNRARPVQVATGVTALAAGAHHSYALRADGQVLAWGRNYRGELGDGTTTTRRTPVAVLGATGVETIGSGRDHGLATRPDGTVLTWGYNGSGQLGDGGTTTRRSAAPVAGIADASAVVGGGEYSMARAVGGAREPQPPTARASVACSGATCTANGGSSTDPDGGTLTYAWDFGDGTTTVGLTSTHEYGDVGIHPVRLTVTDATGLVSTSTTWAPVTSTDPGPGPARPATWVASAQSTANSTTAQVVVPAAVRTGDGLVLALSAASTAAAPVTPAGWSVIGSTATGSVRAVVYSRTADASDADGIVSIGLGTRIKTTLQLLAYRDVAAGTFATAVLTGYPGAGSTRAAPVAGVASAGSAIVGWWTGRASTSFGWTPPAGTLSRSVAIGSGGGQMTALLAEVAPTPAPGSVSPGSAVSSASTGQAVTGTLVLAPAG